MDTLKVGVGRADITPEVYGPMGGFGNDSERICNFIKDRPLGTCIAITDPLDNTILLITTDTLHTNKGQVALLREAITAATGVPGEHIMISATHTHSGPGINCAGLEITQAYYRHQAKQLTKAAKDALEDRKSARIAVGQQLLPLMSFDRHYIMNDGTAYGTGFGSTASGYKAHLDKADEQLQLIRFFREDARDIVIVNWQAHVTFVGRSAEGILSADYVGAFRDHFEGITGCHVAFFQGACGNLTPNSRIESENQAEDYIGYGRLLAEKAKALSENLSPAQGGTIRTKQIQYQAKVNHTEDHRAAAAQEAMEIYRQHPELPHKDRRQLMRDRGFDSYLHAGSIVNRAKADAIVELEMNALCAGDISFCTAPLEAFCSTAVYIKENTPFKMTFFLGYCNGSYSYIPDKYGFQFNSYEVRSCRFEEGTAEDIAQTHVKLLQQLKQA